MVRLGSAMKRRSPERGGSPVQPSSPERRVTHPLLETSPQRRAFSYLLRMLHNANEAKCKCDEEKQRLVPKLLRLLKQARKEKYQLSETYDHVMQKARRDFLSSTKYWEGKVDELKREHTLEIQNLQRALIDKDVECNRLRTQSDKYMDEVVTLEKILRTFQVEKENENVKLKQIVMEHEETIMKVLQKQTEERNATMHQQWEQNEQLKASHAEQIRAMEQRNEKSIEELKNKIMHATTLLLALQSQKDREEHQKQVQMIHNEFMSIANKLKLRTEEPTQYLQHPGKTVEHYHMDLDEVPSTLPMMLSRGEETSESSFKSGTSQSDDTRKQDSSENDRCATIRVLHEKLASEKGRCDGLTERIRYMEQQLSQTVELQEHRRVTMQLEARSQTLIEKIMELDAKLHEINGTMANLQTDHTMALSHAAQELDMTRREVLAEKAVNNKLRDIIEGERQENSNAKTLLQTKINEYEQVARAMEADFSLELKNMNHHVDAARLELAAERSANVEMQAKITALKAELQEMQTTLMTTTEEHTRTARELRDKLAISKRLLTFIKSENIKLQSTLDESNQELNTEKGQNTELKQTLAALKAELEDMQATLTTATEVHERATGHLRDELATNKQRVLDMEAENIRLHSELDASNQELAAERKANAEIHQMHAAVKKENEEIQGKLIKTKLRHDNDVAELKEVLATSQRMLTETTARNDELRKELTRLKREYQDSDSVLKSQLTDLRFDIQIEQTKSQQLAEEIKDINKKHREEIERLKKDHAILLDENQNEIVLIKGLCQTIRQEKQALEDELSEQVMSIEAANDAEISVLKQYIKELETNIEESNSSLAKAKTRQYELIDQLQRLQSHVKVLAPASGEKGGRPPKKGIFSEEGKENNIIAWDHERDISASKEESSTPRLFTATKDPADDDSSSSGILEIRRTLFVSKSPGEHENQIIAHQGTDVPSMSRSFHAYRPERQLPVDLDLFRSPIAHRESFEFDDSLEMEDWRERCYFLEHDREELVRVTGQIIEHEKESHQLQLEAAVATAKREALHEKRYWESHTRQQMRYLYDALCSNCRHKIDGA